MSPLCFWLPVDNHKVQCRPFTPPGAKHCIDVCSPVTCKMEDPHSAGLIWIWSVFTLPTILVLVGNHPDVQVDPNPLLQICDNFWHAEKGSLRIMDDVVTAGSDSVGNWFQEWFIRPETLDILDRWGQFEAYPSLGAAASSEAKAVQTCWISTAVRHLKHSSTSTWSHAWVMLPNALFFSD